MSRVFADKCIAGHRGRRRAVPHLRPVVAGRSAPPSTPTSATRRRPRSIKASVAEGKDLRTVVLERGLLSEEEVDRALDVVAMTKGGIVG